MHTAMRTHAYVASLRTARIPHHILYPNPIIRYDKPHPLYINLRQYEIKSTIVCYGAPVLTFFTLYV